MIEGYADYPATVERDADILVVGTGAGGAVVGAKLAEAGFDVLFVEEGSHHPTSTFNPYVTESVPRLYRDASSTMILGRPPIPYIEGRCVGGSTTVNGGMTWRAPDHVLHDWQQITGSDELGVAGLERHFEEVEAAIHAAPQTEASIGGDSRIMREGAAKKGWRYSPNHRNQEHCVGLNNCVIGCPSGAKKSTLVSYMPRALAAGARCLTDVRVDRLLIRGGRCQGVQGRAIDPQRKGKTRRVRLRARAVVVACGAVQTPVLLGAHRIGRPSGQLGKNFTCHPNAKVLAVYPQRVDGWQGVSQAGQIHELRQEGIMFAENMVPPGALVSQMPFHGERLWELMRHYNQLVLSGVLVEDSTTGRVRRAPFGLSDARYNITAHDHERFLRGTRLLAEMHFEMGADRVILPFAQLHEAHSADDLRKITAENCPINSLDLFTVHLMGTARMGARDRDSVTDLNGQLWDLPGCYVADASLFPTAVGVNPQVTIMAMASRVAERIQLTRKEGRPRAERISLAG